MKNQELKFNGLNQNYSILIGSNTLGLLPKKITKLCPQAKKIAIIIDSKIPNKFIKILRNKLKNYELLIIPFSASEKNKSFKIVNIYLKKILSKNFNRSDIIIGLGGGITGDVAGFIASIFKRGINFINIPTTLLAQVDAAIGGKTGVNADQGKNLIGSFYQPKLVISDTSFLNSLSRKEMVCGYAEILKHSIIKDMNFFNFLQKNTKDILLKKENKLIYAIKKSCQIKMYFVNKDENEKKLRMILNFGHTFAHAIEVKNNYSKKITHGEAVLCGIILVCQLSVAMKACNIKTVNKIKQIYKDNNLTYTYDKYLNQNAIKSLLPYLKNDKKNNDDKINFILLKKIGLTALPGKYKISLSALKNLVTSITQY